MINSQEQIKQQQMYALVEKWKQSTLSQKEFVKQHKISRHKLNYWVTKYNKDSKANKPISKFIPVKVNNDKETRTALAEVIEIIYPNGVRVVVNTKEDLSRIVPLILLQ